MAQQKNSQPPLPPDAQVVKDTSMAETQRKTQKDQQDAARCSSQNCTQICKKLSWTTRLRVAIENAKLTHETIQNCSGSSTGTTSCAKPAHNPSRSSKWQTDQNKKRISSSTQTLSSR